MLTLPNPKKGTTMASKFELKTAADNRFMWNLKAGNGEVILTSQLYKSKDSAMSGIESVKKNCADDGRFERKEAKDSSPFFVLKAANGETIGKSEMYSSKSAMENGIASVMKNAPDARVDEIS